VSEELRDDGEYPAQMEPMLPSANGANRRRLEDLAVDVVAKGHRLAAQLHPSIRSEIGVLVRSMNCYYSNLIEGHTTRPVDIDRALREDYSQNPAKRALQLEARAHIEVHAMLDAATPDKPPALGEPPTSVAFIRGVHTEFCSRLPDDLLWVENPTSGERVRVVPGEFRQRHVKVGRHVPVSPGAVVRFLSRFEAAYRTADLSRIEQILAVPAAHHRLLWIHPFIEGNGRVTRLMSHAMLRDTGIGTSLWSVSRGLARNDGDYKRLLMAADEPRHDDFDGRGALSEAALTDFCDFFLRVCVDQVEFMESILNPATLLGRIEVWLNEQIASGTLHSKSFLLIREAFQKGSLDRGRVPDLTGLGERQARNVLSRLIERGVMASRSHRDPVRLVFSSELAERWFPNLYPNLA
jgi:Fic family protein